MIPWPNHVCPVFRDLGVLEPKERRYVWREVKRSCYRVEIKVTGHASSRALGGHNSCGVIAGWWGSWSLGLRLIVFVTSREIWGPPGPRELPDSKGNR